MNLVNFPFSPNKFPFFYGWVIIVCSIFGCIMTIPGQTMGISVFTDDLISSLGLTRVQLSIAYMIGTIGSALILPFAGRQIDRFGARIIGTFSCVALSLFLVVLGFSPSMLSLVSVDSSSFRVLVAGSIVTFAFLGLRHFGQGVLTVVSRNIIGKWFDRRRGMAVAVSGVFVSLGFGASPRVVNAIVADYGWRGTLFILAAIVGIFAAIIVALFFRDNPEECGLKQDGDTVENGESDESTPVQKEYTADEAKRTLPFWAFNLGLCVQGFVVTAVTFHIADIGRTYGLDRDSAFALFLPLSICSTLMNIAAGYLSDRVKLKYLLIAQMGGILISLIGAAYLESFIGRAALIVGLGTSIGFFGCLTIVVWPKYFGRQHLGAISGYSMGWLVFASAIAPYAFSLSVSMTGAYTYGLLGCVLMPVVVLGMAFFVKDPS